MSAAHISGIFCLPLRPGKAGYGLCGSVWYQSDIVGAGGDARKYRADVVDYVFISILKYPVSRRYENVINIGVAMNIKEILQI
jgi:hypothetical protein